jgi:hypothetical protein
MIVLNALVIDGKGRDRGGRRLPLGYRRRVSGFSPWRMM